MQNLYNLLYREEEREMMPLCADQNIAVIPWSPLAKGNLARKPSQEKADSMRAQTDTVQKRFFSDEDLISLVAQRVAEIAEKHSVSMAQIALAWNLSKSYVTAPIIGATKPYHLDDAVASLEVKLSEDEIVYLEEPYIPQNIVGFA